MPESSNPKKESGKKRRFITEKVVRQPLTRGQIAKRALLLLAAAVVFGAVAAVSFVLVHPIAESYLGTEPAQEPSISIPKDEPDEATTAAPETTQDCSETETEPIEEMVQSAMENYRYTTDDLKELYASLRTQIQKARQAVVVVHSVQQDVDWFDNPVETTGLYTGVVIASSSQELLVLTPEEAIAQADSIKVTFADGSEVNGRMKQKDTLTGMVVVSVSLADMEESTRTAVEPLVLGNSYMVQEGDLVVAVGSPAGIVRSLDYGFISKIMKNVQIVDRSTRVLYAGIHADAGRGTFLLNASGEMIGWAMEESEGGAGMAKFMGISDYKGILEDLTNGRGAPCIGIEGQEVSDAMSEQGLHEGIYVLNVVTDRPAYNGGIQNGDIITAVDGRQIHTMKEYQSILDNLECGQLINITVQRNGRDYYTELEFQVTVEAR